MRHDALQIVYHLDLRYCNRHFQVLPSTFGRTPNASSMTEKRPEGFSLGAGEDKHFIIRSRLQHSGTATPIAPSTRAAPSRDGSPTTRNSRLSPSGWLCCTSGPRAGAPSPAEGPGPVAQSGPGETGSGLPVTSEARRRARLTAWSPKRS
jgi:hypothetical protein